MHQNMKIKLEIESIDPKLSKSGLRMFLRCLVRTKHRRNILRPDFESLGSILSISNLIFIF